MRDDLIEAAIKAGDAAYMTATNDETALHDAFRAVLEAADALASQEAVAWRYEWSPFEFEQWSWNVSLKDPRIAPVRRYRNVQPLFTSPVVPVATPTLDTTISEDTKRALAAIDDNIRAAAAQASTTFVGVPVAAKAEAEGWRLVPDGEKVTLADCPPGLFVSCYGSLCLKSEYGNNEGRIDAYIVESGEFFWGEPPQTIASQRAQLVQPLLPAAPTCEGEGTPQSLEAREP